MNLRHLQYALEVESAGSITRAAKNLLMAQPNLSNALRELEREVGVTIFIRKSTGIDVTRDGKEFLDYARTVVNQFSMLESRYRTGAEKQRKKNFCITTTRSSYVSMAMAEFLNEVLQVDTPLQVKFKEGTTFDVIHDVSSGEADLGVLRANTTTADYFLSLARSKQLKVIHLVSSPIFSVLMSEDHPLADEEALEPHMLDPYAEVIHGDFEVLLFPYSANARETETSSKKLIYCYDRASAMDQLSCVKGSYMWTTATHPHTLRAYHLIEKPCNSPQVNGVDVVVYRNDTHLGDMEKQFIEILHRFAPKP